jgi:hypothetical protein
MDNKVATTQLITSPLDVAGFMSDYSLLMLLPGCVHHMEAHQKAFISAMLTSPLSEKKRGFYSIMCPRPIWVFHHSRPISEVRLKGGLILRSESVMQEGRYHGQVYMQLSNPDMRLNYDGHIVTPIREGDTVTMGLKDMTMVI